MSRENFEVISLLGPLGSGKTTTLNHLIENVPLGDSYAVVVNDVGENNIDAKRIWDHPANRSEKIIPLTAGCIGCSDVTQFREALEKVHDAGVNVLFIEPTGIAPGNEIADVVQSSGFDLSVLTLANARTIERDLKWQVLPSQLSVADIVGITHIPDHLADAEVIDIVLDQLPVLDENVEIKLIKPGKTDYFEVLASLRGVDKQLRLGRKVVDIACGHDHHEDESCESGHGISAKSYRLRPDVSIEKIRSLLMPLTAIDRPLIRAKGVIGDQRFDIVGDEWNTQPDASQLQTMNVIFADHIPESFKQNISEIIDTSEQLVVTGDKKVVVKSISELPVADRVEIINERLHQYPHPISPMHGEIIPDCEADEGYEIAFWGNRDDMPDDIKHAAMEACVSFRLNGLHELEHHAEQIANVEQKTSYWKRRYGATLGYNGYFLSSYISANQLSNIRAVNPARLLCEGLLDLDHMTFDEGRAEEKPEFVASVMNAALERNDITNVERDQLARHMQKLSLENEAFAKRWMTSLPVLEDNDQS